MLASGYNDPAEGSTGSGIFHGRNGSLVSVMSEKNETVLLSAPVPKLIIIDENQKPASSTQKKPIESSKLKFLSDRLEVYNSEIIPFGSDYESKICYGRNFCCNFKVRVNEINTNYSNYYYRAVAFDGVRKFGMSTTGGVQVCGVIFCNGPNILNCTSRVSSLEEIHSFQLLEVEGNFQLKNSFQMPSTLVDEGKLAALKPEYYVFRQKTDLVTNKIMMKLIFPIDGLYTFAIWGRDFNRDGHEPSDSPKSVEESSMTSEEEENISSSKSSDSLEKPDIVFSDSSSLASWPRVILVCLTCLIFRL